jgi:hypothetical protein
MCYYMDIVLQYPYQYQESSLLWSFSTFLTSIFTKIKFIINYPYTLRKKYTIIQEKNKAMDDAMRVHETEMNKVKPEYSNVLSIKNTTIDMLKTTFYQVIDALNINKITEAILKVLLRVTMLDLFRRNNNNNTLKNEIAELKEACSKLTIAYSKLRDENNEAEAKYRLNTDKLNTEYYNIRQLLNNTTIEKEDLQVNIAKLNKANESLTQLIDNNHKDITKYYNELNKFTKQYAFIKDLASTESDYLVMLTQWDKEQEQLNKLISENESAIAAIYSKLTDPMDKHEYETNEANRKKLIADTKAYGNKRLENIKCMIEIHKKMTLNCTELNDEYKKYESNLLKLQDNMKTLLLQSNSSFLDESNKNTSTTSNTSVLDRITSEDLVPQKSGNNPSRRSSTEKNNKAALDTNDPRLIQDCNTVYKYKRGAIPKGEDISNRLPVIKGHVIDMLEKTISTGTPQHSEPVSHKDSSGGLSITESQILQVDKNPITEIIIKKNDPLLTNISQEMDHTHLATSPALSEVLPIIKNVNHV